MTHDDDAQISMSKSIDTYLEEKKEGGASNKALRPQGVVLALAFQLGAEPILVMDHTAFAALEDRLSRFEQHGLLQRFGGQKRAYYLNLGRDFIIWMMKKNTEDKAAAVVQAGAEGVIEDGGSDGAGEGAKKRGRPKKETAEAEVS